MDDDWTIVGHISREIEARLPEWYPGGATFSDARPRLERRKISFVLRFRLKTCHRGDAALYVKIPCRREMCTLAEVVADSKFAEISLREYEATVQVFETFEKKRYPHLCSIRAFAHLPQWNAIVTEELPGRPLDQILLSPWMRFGVTGDRTRLTKALHHAGAWLHVYHRELGDAAVERFEAADVVARIEKKVERMQGLIGQHLDLRSLQEAFSRKLQMVDGMFLPIATQHGDFYCRNVLLTPDGKVGVFDFDPVMQRRAPIYLDLSTLMTDLIVQKVKVRSLGFLIRRGYLERCQNAVVAGYFGASPPDRRLLNLYRAIGAFDSIHWYAIRPRRFTSFLRPLASPLHLWGLSYLYRHTQHCLSLL